MSTFHTFSQYQNDLAKTMNGLEQIYPNKYLAFTIKGALDINDLIKKVDDASFSVRLEANEDNIDYSKIRIAIWDVLKDIVDFSGSETLPVLGDINFLSNDVYSGVNYSDIYVHVSADQASKTVNKRDTAGDDPTKGIFTDEEGNDEFVNVDRSEARFDCILVFYGLYKIDPTNKDSSHLCLVKDMPMGMYVLENPATVYIENEDIYGNGTSWTTRICSRIATVSEDASISSNDGKSAEWATLSKVLTDFGSLASTMRAIVSKRNPAEQEQNDNKKVGTDYQDILSYLEEFKNDRVVNVPYIKDNHWFVNGKDLGLVLDVEDIKNKYEQIIENTLNGGDAEQIISNWLESHKSELKGEKGEDGANGLSGEQGQRGAQGPPGSKGRDGFTFIPNINDGLLSFEVQQVDEETAQSFADKKYQVKGEKGEKGEKGDTGKRWVPFLEDGHLVFKKYPNNAGEGNADSEYNGQDSIDFGDLKGDKGERGDAGPQGPQGKQGPQGDPGISGSQYFIFSKQTLPAGQPSTPTGSFNNPSSGWGKSFDTLKPGDTLWYSTGFAENEDSTVQWSSPTRVAQMHFAQGYHKFKNDETPSTMTTTPEFISLQSKEDWNIKSGESIYSYGVDTVEWNSKAIDKYVAPANNKIYLRSTSVLEFRSLRGLYLDRQLPGGSIIWINKSGDVQSSKPKHWLNSSAALDIDNSYNTENFLEKIKNETIDTEAKVDITGSGGVVRSKGTAGNNEVKNFAGSNWGESLSEWIKESAISSDKIRSDWTAADELNAKRFTYPYLWELEVPTGNNADRSAVRLEPVLQSTVNNMKYNAGDVDTSKTLKYQHSGGSYYNAVFVKAEDWGTDDTLTNFFGKNMGVGGVGGNSNNLPTTVTVWDPTRKGDADFYRKYFVSYLLSVPLKQLEKSFYSPETGWTFQWNSFFAESYPQQMKCVGQWAPHYHTGEEGDGDRDFYANPSIQIYISWVDEVYAVNGTINATLGREYWYKKDMPENLWSEFTKSGIFKDKSIADLDENQKFRLGYYNSPGQIQNSTRYLMNADVYAWTLHYTNIKTGNQGVYTQ